ncbi:hypothetical protein N9948_02165 [bacterium]|nr:hypothetical protein [bacterium]
MRYIVVRDHPGCNFSENDVFSYTFDTEMEAYEQIQSIMKYKNTPNSLDFIKDSKKLSLEKAWAESHKIGPVNYYVVPIHN